MRIRVRGSLPVWVAGAVLLTVSACKNRSEVPEGKVASWASAPADTQWVTVEGVEFPAGLEKADPEVIEAYVFAAKHPEVLQYMPCYCGCEHPRSAHESNYDCFIDIIDRTGALPRISPDPMGFS
ncbi:MAG TPA: PCYCGC motif-containing (lipo)protein [Gemmatimonadota bacterium]|nr:PCYCGC motif-containing (lipo)protein [Gemmatimonadota bacterium]